MKGVRPPCGVAFAVWLCCAAGCGAGQGIERSGPGAGSVIHSIDDLDPADVPPERAVLQLAGGTVSKIPVTIRAERQGDLYMLHLIAHDEILESEVYSVTSDEFRLVEAAGEKYSPALPLLKFPARIGEAAPWRGDITIGGRSHPAWAEVRSQKDKIDLGGFSDDALQVQVVLTIESGGTRPTTRLLVFWFAKGKGLVKREFGQASTRSPASESPGA